MEAGGKRRHGEARPFRENSTFIGMFIKRTQGSSWIKFLLQEHLLCLYSTIHIEGPLQGRDCSKSSGSWARA